MLDPSALDRLRRIGGDKLLHAMMDSFLENGAARMAAARQAVAAGDANGVSDAAHALKSSAGNVGATTLQMEAQRVEREAREQGADLAALVDALGAAYDSAARAAVGARARSG